MESHSSSASLASRCSHGMTCSSSSASPYFSSSPESPSLQPSCHQGISIPGAVSIVPFVWEEKPGVRKKAETRKETQEPADERHINPSSCTDDKHSAAIHSTASNKNPPPRAKISPENHPPLRPPPRLLIRSSSAYLAQAADHTLQRRHHHHHKLSQSSVGQAMPSSSFYTRRHQKGSSLHDDPFQLAMVVCRNEGEGSSKGNGAGCRSGGGGGLAKKIQEHIVHFDQCIPRHGLSGRRLSKLFQGQGRSADRPSRVEIRVAMDSSYSRSICNDKVAAKAAYNSANCKSGVQRDEANVRGSVEKAIVKEGKPPISAISHIHQADRATGSRSVDDTRFTGKALDAFKVSEAGLHNRDKDVLQQQPSSKFHT